MKFTDIFIRKPVLAMVVSLFILLFGLRADHGATLVLVTHDPDLAQRCDRVIRLADGRLATEVAA